MRKAYTFRSTTAIDARLHTMMTEWNLDRTSIIKLALYLFAIHSLNTKVRKQDLWSLVQEIEQMAPPDFPDYATFAD